VLTGMHSGTPTSMPTTAQLSERLYNVAQGHAHVYVLLDRHSENPLQEELAVLPDADAVCLPLLDELFENNPTQSPLLLCLQRGRVEHAEVLERSIALALKQALDPSASRSVCAWLVSDAEPKRVQNALTQRLDAHWPGGQRMYFRYFDPRVMPRLMQVLSAAEQAQLFGPVKTWCQLGRSGQWLAFAPSAQAAADMLPLLGRMRLNESTAQAVDRIELVSLTLAALRKQGSAPDQTQDIKIDRAVQAAHTQGIITPEDTVAYAWRAVLWGSAFTAHPALQALMSQARSAELPLEPLLQEKFQLV
jgi:Domain of unknown function (DUF4123)